MRLFLTGGAGCLGSNLTERFLGQGHEVLILDNFATGRREIFPDALLAGLEIVTGTVEDADLVTSLMERFQPSHVIHAAASYKDPDDWRTDASVNVEGSINVVRAAERAGVKRLVNLQTALCYGCPDEVPIPVTAPVRPFTSYGISKTAGELYMMQADLPVVSLRLANVTGPRLAIGPIPTFYQRLKAGKGCFCSDTVRDFLDMQDFFTLIDRVLADDTPTGIYNVSTGEGRTIKDVFDAVVAHLGIKPEGDVPIVPPGDHDVPAVVLDPSSTERELGWSARYDFKATMSRMLAWYDQHGIDAIYSHLKAPSPNR
ncbi:MAG: NAD-dependent epimerase/dehydratase family protein [Geminicoccaceae bacterium]